VLVVFLNGGTALQKAKRSFRDLQGLTEEQKILWKQPTQMEHAGGVRSHEDEPGELGFFWATKIGGPSHGFDYESQCILPLLANARHKVILVSDPKWPAHPVGRAHFRLLWSVGEEGTSAAEPRLWVETVNSDFEADVSSDVLEDAGLQHALSKAHAMKVPLSAYRGLSDDLEAYAKQRGGQVKEVCECILLRPSNAVVEASDYLSPEHDWVQVEEEITDPISRILYIPPTSK